MRITPLAQSRLTLQNLRQAAARKASAAAEISSGLRVRQPSDSPVEAAGVTRTKSELARIAQLRDNLETARAELRAVDGGMFQATNALTRAAELAVQAATGTQDARGRDLIREEVEGVLRGVVDIANAVHGGRFVFAGGLDSQAPFEFDPNDPTRVVYRGDSSSRSISFPDGRPAAVSLPGDAIFALADEFVGAGRTAPTAGPAPNPPVGLGLSFSGDVAATISVDLRGFFVASSPPAGASAGDTVAVNLVSDDGTVSETLNITLAGGEAAADLAAALNAAVAANPNLAGALAFSDEGGALKLTVSDTFGQGFSFTSNSVGGVTTGLEAGGSVGGFSAGEIAAALNAAVAAEASLAGAGVRFEARDGEVVVDGDVDFTFTAVDFARGANFASGLAGTHQVGGVNSADVFGTLSRFVQALRDDDQDALQGVAGDLQRAVDHVSGKQGFFGATLRRTEATLDNLARLDVVNQERLSLLQDADLLKAIGDLQSASSAEEAAIQITGRQRPNLLDVLG